MRTLQTCLVLVLSLALAGCPAEIKTIESCGDGLVDPGEQCDGADTTAGNCEDLGYYQQLGDLVCRSDCTLDTSVCLSRCGDDVIQVAFGEQCEGGDLAAETCQTLGLGSGNLACNDSCHFDTSACENDIECGDGVIIGRFEDCEGEDLAGQTCASLGYYGGQLACDPYTCAFELAGCENFGRCGDNAVQATYAEDCDGSELGGATCESLGYYGGTLTCDVSCRFLLTDCAAHGSCGDGEVQTDHGEVCEDGLLGGATCESRGWYGGELACGAGCTALDEADCAAVGRCGDHAVQPGFGETCDGPALGGATCRDYDFFTGRPSCDVACQLGPGDCVNATRVTAREFFACARNTDGTVSCWGANEGGQLGDGTTLGRLTPVRVGGLHTATAVAAGLSHACALLADQTVRCWGFNDAGQLGDGSTSASTTPVPVAGLADVAGLVAGYSHTCARLTNGAVRCWGKNTGGQLGDGSLVNRTSPVAPEGIENVVSIAAGDQHTCAVLPSGVANCWGVNGAGQLGDGTTTRRPTPVAVVGLSDALVVAAGFNHTCAILGDGSARCWGSNSDGQLGNGTTSFLAVHTPVVVSGLSGAGSLALGFNHSCAQVTDGTLRCWGNNASGTLGDGTNLPRYSPVAVGFGAVTSFSAGKAFTCAVPASGIPHCWGNNDNGELGNGTVLESLVPVAVSP